MAPLAPRAGLEHLAASDGPWRRRQTQYHVLTRGYRDGLGTADLGKSGLARLEHVSIQQAQASIGLVRAEDRPKSRPILQGWHAGHGAHGHRQPLRALERLGRGERHAAKQLSGFDI